MLRELMMTEADAWRLVLDSLLLGRQPICEVIKNRLCDVPTLLRITMLGRMRDNKPSDAASEELWWPLDEAGLKKRVAFVRSMIEQSKDAPPLDFFTVDVGS